MKIVSRIFVLAITLIIVACSSDDNSGVYTSEGDFTDGFFVLNEGNSNISTASVTFIGNDGRIEQDIFRAINPNTDEIGTYLQNIFFDETKAYIISGSANSVTVVNRYTFEYITTISTNLNNPRYGVVSNGKAFVTNLGDFSATGGWLTVIDLSDYSTTKLELNTTAERIIVERGKVYVSNGYYGNGNTIMVVDSNSLSIQTINLGIGNTPITLDQKNGFMYVLTSSTIEKINMSNNTITETIIIPSEITAPRNLTIEGNKIYFTGNSTSVYSLELTATTISSYPLLTYQSSSSAWGSLYGFAVKDGKIYIADVNGDGASDGKVSVYSTSGSFITDYTVGVIPNGFYFND